MDKCIFCGDTKMTFHPYDGMRCENCGKLRRICKNCNGELEYKNGTYICKDCGNLERYLRRDEKEEFNKDPIFYTEHLIQHALEDYDKKFRALLIMMVQKGLIKDVNELEDVLKSIDLLNTLKDS